MVAHEGQSCENYRPIVPMSENIRPSVDLPTDQELVLKVIPMPADCNANGDIFGGWVMAQVDLAGSVLPARQVRGRMATVAVNGKPEVAVVAPNGWVYFNIEDTREIAALNPVSAKVVLRKKLKNCESPSGLAMDDQRRF